MLEKHIYNSKRMDDTADAASVNYGVMNNLITLVFGRCRSFFAWRTSFASLESGSAGLIGFAL